MGTDQQFCLRWNNFHTSITSAFESLRDDEDFVDITLACDGKHIKAHKMVLSACSPYFRNLLKGNPCQHPIVFLKDVTFSNLTSILDFMYHGEVNVSHNDLATFLKTAEALKVRGLAEDDKKKDAENYIEASSPGPPRDPPDPGSPKQDETSATDTHLSDSSPPPSKRHRRRSGTSVQSAEDTSETVLSDLRETSVKNEPQEFNDEDEMLGHSLDGNGDIKNDNMSSEVNDDRNFGPSESVSISRSQAAMQQLQESFGSFLPSMSQSSGYIPHGANDMARPSFPLDGVQGIPPGISTLPGPSMSQASVGQDGSQEKVAILSGVKEETENLSSGSIRFKRGRRLEESPRRLMEASLGRRMERSLSEEEERFSPLSTSHHVSYQQKNNVRLSSIFGLSPPSDMYGSGEAVKVSEDKGGSHDGFISPLGYSDILSGRPSLGRGSQSYRNLDLDVNVTNKKPMTGDEVQCRICGRMLCNKYVLKVHERDVHSPRKMHQCALCGRCYSTINSLRVHMSTTHKYTSSA